MYARKFAAVLLIVVAFSASSCTKWPEKKKATWRSATSGEQLVNLFWQDVKAKRWKSLDRRIAPIMLAVNSQAVLDHDGTLPHLKTIEVENFQIGEVRTEPAGADLIVTYTIAARGTVAGQPIPAAPVRMMSIWQQVGAAYILVAHATIPAAQ